MGQDLPDVVTAAVEDGEDSVTAGALQGASEQSAIRLHVADLCFDGASTEQICDQFWRKATPSVADYHPHRFNDIAAIHATDGNQIKAPVCQYLYLFNSLFQGVVVVSVPGKAARASHKLWPNVVATLTLQTNS